MKIYSSLCNEVAKRFPKLKFNLSLSPDKLNEYFEIISKFEDINQMIYPRNKPFNYILSNLKEFKVEDKERKCVIEYNSEILDNYFTYEVDKEICCAVEDSRLLWHYCFGKYRKNIKGSNIQKSIEANLMRIVSVLKDNRLKSSFFPDPEIDVHCFLFLLSSATLGKPTWDSISSDQTRFSDCFGKINKIIEDLVKVQKYRFTQGIDFTTLSNMFSKIYLTLYGEVYLRDIKIDNLIINQDNYNKLRKPRTDVINYTIKEKEKMPGKIIKKRRQERLLRRPRRRPRMHGTLAG